MKINNSIAMANKLFREGDYAASLRHYEQAVLAEPELQKVISLNITLARKKLRENGEYTTPSRKSNRIVVYTCNFGNYESVKEPILIDPEVDYVLFTDNEQLTSEHWRVVVLTEAAANPRRLSRLPKIVPHKYLPPHDISIYLDSSLELKTNDISKMIRECMGGRDIALYKHYQRNCVYDEIEFVMNSSDRKVEDRSLCLRAIEKYKAIGYPANNGLFENAIIFRRNSEIIRTLSEMWWDEYTVGAERDQFTLMYCLHKLSIFPHPISMGKQFRDNPYVNFYKHAYKSYSSISDEAVDKSKKGITSVEILCSGEPEKRGTVNWVVGGDDNAGWAYENNAKRFISELYEFDHLLQGNSYADVALYFDVLLYHRMRVPSAQRVVRIGGPRPIERLCDNNTQKLKEVLSGFHAVICLNNALFETLSLVHPNVHMIPNGLDLNRFEVTSRDREVSKPFTVGFAGSVKSSAEREVKGLDYVMEAAAIAGVKVLNVGRGKGQTKISHDRMISDFYSEIDALVHPVGPGREGSSNVVMEALALGIPVITTEHAGYHAERLEDLKNVLFCKRDPDDIAEKILALSGNKELYDRLSREGRLFAERHHDIRNISARYKALITSAVEYHNSKQKISIVPFWLPAKNFATGRLRCIYVADMLSEPPARSARLGYDPAADVVVISQLADDDTYFKLVNNSNQFVIYDICDRYYADPRVVGGVHAQKRFRELAERANVIVVSTLELKKELYSLSIDKPIVHIPDGIDFQEVKNNRGESRTLAEVKTVGWFGNPGRGNFESAMWVLKGALQLNKDVKIITDKNRLKKYPEFYRYAEEWRYDTFLSMLSQCDVVVVTHAKDEQNKSPNRLLTAVVRGVPVLVSSSKSCEEILHEAGLGWAVINDNDDLENALRLLSYRAVREMYLKLVSAIIERRYGYAAIKRRYADLLDNYVYRPSSINAKVLFVSHNLNTGEGAPTSLFQTVSGLKKYYDIEPVVFCPMTGGVKDLYEGQGIDVICYENQIFKNSLKPLVSNFDKAKRDFQSLLMSGSFDMVICNTAKMLPYASFSREVGIPSICIIRESSDEHVDLTFVNNASVLDAAKNALRDADSIVFVADATRKIWQSKHFLPRAKVINNGILTDSWKRLTASEKAKLRGNLGLPSDKKIMLCVGTINARKAQIDLVNAYQSLPVDVRENSLLVLVGARESKYLARFKEAVSHLPSEAKKNIFIIPETEDVATWYQVADIFVFSSHNESYPRVIVEALYFGLRVISTKVFGVTEQLRGDRSALLYDIGDIPSLAEAMEAQITCEQSAYDTEHFYQLTTYHEMLARYHCEIYKHLSR